MIAGHEQCPDCGQWKVECRHCNGAGRVGNGHFGSPRCRECEGAGARCPDAESNSTNCGRTAARQDKPAADSRADPPDNPAAMADAKGIFSDPFSKRDPSLIPWDYQLPPDGLVVVTVAKMYASIHYGLPARRCIDACRILHYAYAQFGIRSELRAVVVTIRADDGRTERTPVPSWNGTELVGHAILCLPDAVRFVDATVDQFPGVGGTGPVIGRTVAPLGGAGGGDGPFPAGIDMPMRRGNLTLMYTLGSDETTRLILDHPNVRAAAEQYRRQGIQLAGAFLAGLHASPLAAHARKAPYPRLVAFLDAIDGATIGHDDDGYWYMIPPSPARLRLDEIPLPAGTPARAPEDLGPDSH